MCLSLNLSVLRARHSHSLCKSCIAAGVLRRIRFQNRPRHCAYSMRFFKHTGLRAAWNMRSDRGLGLLLSLLFDCRPVVDRRLLTFLASPRRVSKRRRRKVAVPSGCPIVQVKKWEKFETRYAQTRTFLIHFLPRTSGSATCEKRRSTHP